MAEWSTDFRLALAQEDYYPRYLIEWVNMPAGTLRGFGGNLRLASWYTGPGYLPAIQTTGSSFQGGRLTPRSWTSQPGSFELGVDLSGPEGDQTRQTAQRGQSIVLKVGLFLKSTRRWVYEPVLLAQLTNIKYAPSPGSSTGWVLSARGLEGALNNRLTWTTSYQFLCHDLADTEITADYTVGATTVTVTSTASFRMCAATSAGVIKLTPASGDPFYLTYTGTTATTFTGVSATGQFGTTAANITAGPANNVRECAYTVGHPIEIMQRVLSSTGANGSADQNGPADVLPASWGFGLGAEHIADRDMLAHVAYTQPSSGADDHVWLVDDYVEDAQALLNTWLNSGGYFLTQHHGRLTCRAALQPWALGTSGLYYITDDDIVALSGYSQWGEDSANQVEYQQTKVAYADDGYTYISAKGPVDHHPTKGINTHTPGGLYSGNSNVTAIENEIGTRLKSWDTRTAEIVRLTLRGWSLAKASPGDTCKLTTSLLRSRDGRDFSGRDALVLRCSPNWLAAAPPTVDIELAILPDDESPVPWRT